MEDEEKVVNLENQIVIMSVLRNILEHYTALSEAEVVKNIEHSNRLKEILTNRIKVSKLTKEN